MNRTDNDPDAIFLAPSGGEGEEHADPTADGSAEAMRRLRHQFQVWHAARDARPNNEYPGMS